MKHESHTPHKNDPFTTHSDPLRGLADVREFYLVRRSKNANSFGLREWHLLSVHGDHFTLSRQAYGSQPDGGWSLGDCVQVPIEPTPKSMREKLKERGEELLNFSTFGEMPTQARKMSQCAATDLIFGLRNQILSKHGAPVKSPVEAPVKPPVKRQVKRTCEEICDKVEMLRKGLEKRTYLDERAKDEYTCKAWAIYGEAQHLEKIEYTRVLEHVGEVDDLIATLFDKWLEKESK